MGVPVAQNTLMMKLFQLCLFATAASYVHATGPTGKAKKIDADGASAIKIGKAMAQQLQKELSETSMEDFALECVVDAFEQPFEASVVEQQKEDLGGFAIVTQSPAEKEGSGFYVNAIISRKSRSVMMQQLNPWPTWQLTAAKAFRSKDKKMLQILSSVTPHKREDLSIINPAIRVAVSKCVEHLTEKNSHRLYTLAAVINVEKQTLKMEQLNKASQAEQAKEQKQSQSQAEKNPFWGAFFGNVVKHVKRQWVSEANTHAYFISLLVNEQQKDTGSKRVVPYLFAVVRNGQDFDVDGIMDKAETNIVASRVLPTPGYAVVLASLTFNPAPSLSPKKLLKKSLTLRRFQSAVVAAISWTMHVPIAPEMVKVVSARIVGDTADVEKTFSAPQADSKGEGVEVTFTVGFAGDGSDLADLLAQTSFSAALQREATRSKLLPASVKQRPPHSSAKMKKSQAPGSSVAAAQVTKTVVRVDSVTTIKTSLGEDTNKASKHLSQQAQSTTQAVHASVSKQKGGFSTLALLSSFVLGGAAAIGSLFLYTTLGGGSHSRLDQGRTKDATALWDPPSPVLSQGGYQHVTQAIE